MFPRLKITRETKNTSFMQGKWKRGTWEGGTVRKRDRPETGILILTAL